MRKLGIAVGLLLWAMVLFVAVFWLTFPSEPLANRLRYEVPRVLGEEWSADVDSVSPWWAGVSVKKVKLYTETADEEGVVAPQLAALVDVASVRLAILKSLFAGAPYLKGRTTLTEGEVAWEVGTAMEGGKGTRISDLVLSSDALPIGDILTIFGAPASVAGNVAMAVDLRGGETGMRDAAGSIELDGANLVLSDVEIPGLGPLGMEIPISTLAIHAKVEKGRATLEQSRIVSELFTADFTGDVTLRDPLDRSSVAVKIVLSELGPQLAAFEGFLGSKNSDGDYEINCRGNLSRILESCTVGAERRSSRPTARPPSSSGSDETDEDRERSRADIQERVRKRREERENRRKGTSTAPVAPTIDPEEEEEEPIEEPIEEPTDNEELGPDEEEPLE